MIVLTDVVGDEDPAYLEYKHLEKFIQDSIYKSLMCTKPISYEETLKSIESQYIKVLIDAVQTPSYDPKVQCELQEDGKINVTFLAPQWIKDLMVEEGVL